MSIEYTKATLELDRWEKALEKEELPLLEKCQSEHQVQSCMKCEHLLKCETRERYIAAVYESMSKGGGGGFEF